MGGCRWQTVVGSRHSPLTAPPYMYFVSMQACQVAFASGMVSTAQLPSILRRLGQCHSYPYQTWGGTGIRGRWYEGVPIWVCGLVLVVFPWV